MFSNWYWRRLLRVPWTARRSNLSILKKINPEYSLEGLRLKLQLICSVQFSCSVMSYSLRPHGLQHARLPSPSPTPRAFSNSCPSQQCHPTISSSILPFSSRLQSFPTSGSCLVSQFFASGGQKTGASASVLLMNIQG